MDDLSADTAVEETGMDETELEDISEEEEIDIPEEIEDILSDDDVLPEEEELDIPADLEDILPDDEPELTEEPEDILTEEEELDTPADLEDILPDDEPELPEELEDILTEEEQEPETEVIAQQELADSTEDDLSEDPMEELKNASAKSAGGDQDSFDKLKTLSKKIIDGEEVDLGIDIKTEISELLRLILDTKKRVDEIEPTLATSKEHLPNVLSALESVSETTEDATLTLMESADGLSGYYTEFLEEINDLEDLLYKKNVPEIVRKLESIEKNMEEADSMGYNILHALEFQDITEQKIHKVIGAVSDIGARIGAILGFIKLKQEQDPTVADDASQEDIDKLLADFGLD